MAWQARIANDIGLGADLNYQIAVEYYDTVTPTEVLHAETFVLSINATTAQLQAKVIERGQEARAAYQRWLSAKTAVPVGTTVNIP